VLRVYRDARGPERAQREACVQNAVEGLGFPTPRVLLTCVDRRVLGGAFQVMRRLRGRVMLDAILGPRVLRMPAERAARQIVAAIARRRPEVVITGHGKAAVFLQRHVPWLVSWGVKTFRVKGRSNPGGVEARPDQRP